MDYAYDFSVVPGPDPSYLKDTGAQGVLVYSGNARQSDDYLNQCRSLGLKVVWIWEQNEDSILTADGAAACRAHETRAHPGELTYVACDLNNGALAGRDVTRFCREWSGVTREPEFGLYGPSDAIAQAQAAQIPKLTKWWGVVNWITGGGPNNDPRNIEYWRSVGAHIVQLIGSPIANTDQNLILRDDWSAPAAPAPVPAPVIVEGDEVIPILVLDGPQAGVYVPFGHKLVKLPGVNTLSAGRTITVTGEEFDAGFGDAVKAALAG